MNSKNLAAVAFTILGLAALLSSVSILQGLMVFPLFQGEFDRKTIVILAASLFPFIVLLGTGVFLIVKRFRLAAWVVFDSSETDTEQAWKELPDLAFAILGLYLVVTSLPSLGSLAGKVVTLKASPNLHGSQAAIRASLGVFVGTLVQFVAGGYLFLNAREVGRWWRQRGKTNAKAAIRGRSRCPGCDAPIDVGDYREGASARRCSACKAEIPDSAFE